MLGKWFKFSLLVTLLLSPTLAFADEVVQFAATAAALYFGGPWAALAVSTAFGVYGAEQQRKAYYAAQEKARQDYNAGLKDRTITRIATEAPYRYVYGTARVGSDVVAIFSSGDKDQYKHLVCIHAAHECQSIDEIFIAGEALGPLDANGDVTSGKYFVAHTDNIKEFPTGGNLGPGISNANNVNLYRAKITTLTFNTLKTVDTGTLKVVEQVYNSSGDNAVGMYTSVEIPATISGQTVTLSRLPTDPNNVVVSYTNSSGTSRVRVKKHLGTPTDPADASLIAEVPSKWTSAATLRGFCYTVIRLDLNQPEFQSGIPTIEPLIKGKKLYDPRTGLTTWSSNPALAIYDYLTSEICGVPVSDLPTAQFITAANVCDEATSYSYKVWVPAIGSVPAHVNTITGNYPKYTINGTVTSDQSQAKMLEAMAQCMAGTIVSTSWDISAGKYVAPVKALYQEDIVGSLAITPGISDADIYNGIKGQYIDVANKYVATDFTPYQNATYLASDGRDLFSNIDFQFTDSIKRVHNLCRIFTEDQRNGFTIKAEFSLKAWGLKVGQRVTFTSSFLGQTAKVYRITDKRYSPNSSVELTLKEDAASIWDYADAILVDDTVNTDLPNPFDIDPLASITCTSGANALMLQTDGSVVSRIKVEWPIATTQAVLTNGYIEIQWQEISETNWHSFQANGTDTVAYLSPVRDKMIYIVRARCVNPYLNVKSNWVYSYTQVIGKTSAPPNVASFAVSVKAGGTRQFTFDTTGQPVDVKAGGGYIIRYRVSGSGTPWATMTSLHTGFITQSPYETNSPVAGTYDFAIVAVDSSGNQSASPVFVTNAIIGNEPVKYGSSANLLANSDWQIYTGTNSGASSWYKWDYGFGTFTTKTVGRNYPFWNPGRGGAWLSDTGSVGTTNQHYLLQNVPVVAGQAYEASVLVNPGRCKAFLFVNWLNSSNALISQSSDSFDNGSSTLTGGDVNLMKQLWLTATAPVGAVSASFYCLKQATNTGNTDSYAFFNRAMFCTAKAGVTRGTATPWIESGVDQIHGGGIESLSVGTAQIANAAIATAKLADNAATDTLQITSTSQNKTDANTTLTLSYTPPNNCTATLMLVGTTVTGSTAGAGAVTIMSPLKANFKSGGSQIGPIFTVPSGPVGNTAFDLSINLSYKLDLVSGTAYTFGVNLTDGVNVAPSGSTTYLANTGSLSLKLEVIKK